MTFLKQARLAAGLTQEELARRAGVSQPTISALENAVQRMSPRVAEEMVWALKVSTSEADLRAIHERDVLHTFTELIDKATKGRRTDSEAFSQAMKDATFRRTFKSAILSAVESGEPRAAEFAMKAIEAADADFATKAREGVSDAFDLVGRPKQDRDDLILAAEKGRAEFDSFGRPRERDRDASFEQQVAAKASTKDEFDHFGRPSPERASKGEGHDAVGRPRRVREVETPRGRAAPTDDERERERITEEHEREKRREKDRERWSAPSVPGLSDSAQKALASAPVLGRPAVEKFLKEGRDVSVREGFGLMKAAVKASPSISSDPAFKEVVGELMVRSEKGEK